MKDIILIPTERPLLLYDIFKGSEQVGYTVTYDNYDRRYKMWDGYYLREDFGVFLKDGKLMRHVEDRFDL